MRLLIITQKVDRDDPVLGFFHRWIEEFAKHFGTVTVICLGKGEFDLPENVKIFSLGKPSFAEASKGKGRRLEYVWNFYKYILRERENYDRVFVHMNQEYVLLGGVLWKLWGKKIFMWRNHAKGDLRTDLAVKLSDKVFCTSPASYTAKFSKTVQMPIGVDINFFKPDPSVRKKKNSILFLGRMSPVKNVEAFADALKVLREKKFSFNATIAGSALSRDKEYEKMIKYKVAAMKLSGSVEFVGAVTQKEALKLYQKHGLYVNLTLSGSLDKTIVEALSSGSKVVVANQFFKSYLPETWVVDDPKDCQKLAENIEKALLDSHGYNSETQGHIAALIEENSLEGLMKRLEKELT